MGSNGITSTTTGGTNTAKLEKDQNMFYLQVVASNARNQPLAVFKRTLFTLRKYACAIKNCTTLRLKTGILGIRTVII